MFKYVSFEHKNNDKITHRNHFATDSLYILMINEISKITSYTPIKDVKIARNLADNAASLIGNLNLGKNLALISDENTYPALHKKLEDKLASCFEINSIILPKGVKPTDKQAAFIRGKTEDAAALVAIGSGTINDLCKYASFLDSKPYIVFGTAPSMNGYASANASIMIDNCTKSLPAHLPVGIFLDLDILANAPKRLIRSGLGDSLCRSTSQADWLLSHLMLGTYYNEKAFLLSDERALLDKATALLNGDIFAIELLAKTLVLSGIGMYISGGSYPASQGEHLLAHYVQIMGGGTKKTFHGEQIGVTTLIMAKLQERLLAQEKLTVRPQEIDNEDIINHFGNQVGEYCIKQWEKKWSYIRDMKSKNWREIRSEIKKITVPYEILHKTLQEAGAPTNYDDLGWSDDLYRNAIKYSMFLRDRFTFMDLTWCTADITTINEKFNKI